MINVTFLSDNVWSRLTGLCILSFEANVSFQWIKYCAGNLEEVTHRRVVKPESVGQRVGCDPLRPYWVES